MGHPQKKPEDQTGGSREIELSTEEVSLSIESSADASVASGQSTPMQVPPPVPEAEPDPVSAPMDLNAAIQSDLAVEVVDSQAIAEGTPSTVPQSAPVKSAGTKSLKLVPPAGSKTAVVSQAASVEENDFKARLKKAWIKVQDLFQKYDQKSSKQSEKLAEATEKVSAFVFSKPVMAVVAVFLLICGTYGYFVYEQYERGPYAVWKKITKLWKKGDFIGLQEHVSDTIDTIPLFIMERYPDLVFTNEAEFGPLIKKVYKARRSAYEKEFKKGYSSHFWDFEIKEMVDYGDRFELRYEFEQEKIVFNLEKEADDWKLVSIETSKTKNLFEIPEEEIKGESTL